jgi:hypothetical protein
MKPRKPNQSNVPSDDEIVQELWDHCEFGHQFRRSFKEFKELIIKAIQLAREAERKDIVNELNVWLKANKYPANHPLRHFIKILEGKVKNG